MSSLSSLRMAAYGHQRDGPDNSLSPDIAAPPLHGTKRKWPETSIVRPEVSSTTTLPSSTIRPVPSESEDAFESPPAKRTRRQLMLQRSTDPENPTTPKSHVTTDTPPPGRDSGTVHRPFGIQRPKSAYATPTRVVPSPEQTRVDTIHTYSGPATPDNHRKVSEYISNRKPKANREQGVKTRASRRNHPHANDPGGYSEIEEHLSEVNRKEQTDKTQKKARTINRLGEHRDSLSDLASNSHNYWEHRSVSVSSSATPKSTQARVQARLLLIFKGRAAEAYAAATAGRPLVTISPQVGVAGSAAADTLSTPSSTQRAFLTFSGRAAGAYAALQCMKKSSHTHSPSHLPSSSVFGADAPPVTASKPCSVADHTVSRAKSGSRPGHLLLPLFSAEELTKLRCILGRGSDYIPSWDSLELVLKSLGREIPAEIIDREWPVDADQGEVLATPHHFESISAAPSPVVDRHLFNNEPPAMRGECLPYPSGPKDLETSWQGHGGHSYHAPTSNFGKSEPVPLRKETTGEPIRIPERLQNLLGPSFYQQAVNKDPVSPINTSGMVAEHVEDQHLAHQDEDPARGDVVSESAELATARHLKLTPAALFPLTGTPSKELVLQFVSPEELRAIQLKHRRGKQWVPSWKTLRKSLTRLGGAIPTEIINGSERPENRQPAENEHSVVPTNTTDISVKDSEDHDLACEIDLDDAAPNADPVSVEPTPQRTASRILDFTTQPSIHCFTQTPPAVSCAVPLMRPSSYHMPPGAIDLTANDTPNFTAATPQQLQSSLRDLIGSNTFIPQMQECTIALDASFPLPGAPPYWATIGTGNWPTSIAAMQVFIAAKWDPAPMGKISPAGFLRRFFSDYLVSVIEQVDQYRYEYQYPAMTKRRDGSVAWEQYYVCRYSSAANFYKGTPRSETHNCEGFVRIGPGKDGDIQVRWKHLAVHRTAAEIEMTSAN
jgi:hypothetical protein